MKYTNKFSSTSDSYQTSDTLLVRLQKARAERAANRQAVKRLNAAKEEKERLHKEEKERVEEEEKRRLDEEVGAKEHSLTSNRSCEHSLASTRARINFTKSVSFEKYQGISGRQSMASSLIGCWQISQAYGLLDSLASSRLLVLPLLSS